MPMLVENIMSKAAKSVILETSLAEAMSIMQEYQVCSLAGLKSYDDINKAILGLTSTKVAA